MASKTSVTFYTKAGCHLCEDAKREIERAGCSDLYDFEEIDILTDPDLQRRYGTEIPVVLINGTHAFKYRLTAGDFRRAIQKQHRER